MTPARFKQLVEKHFADPEQSGNDQDLGQQAFARWLPVHPRTMRRWIANGPPPATARLMLTIDKLGGADKIPNA